MKSEHIIGYITNFAPERVKGFVYSSNNDEPQKVDLFINDKYIDSQVANEHVPLLEKNEMIPEKGFYFNLKEIGVFHFRDKLEVRVGNVTLPKSPWLNINLTRAGYLQASDQSLFFFMHIPKTAGTTLRFMLYKHFEQEKIWPNKADLVNNEGRYPSVPEMRELPSGTLESKRLIMGHYPMWSLRYMPVRPEVITFLREPLNHIISLTSHKRDKQDDLKNVPIHDIINKEVMDNPQTYFFLPAHYSTSDINEDIFKIAIRNLESCEFVGLTERFKEGVRYLEEKYNWSLGKRMKKNRGNKVKLTSSHKELLKSKINWDEKLYKRAEEIFEQKISK